MRGAARALNTSKGTVLRKLEFLGKIAKEVCEKNWEKPENKTNYIQFDELETSHRTQCLPLTIAFAVRWRTGDIITAHVDTKPCMNSLASVSQQKYGERENNRERAIRGMLRDIKKVVKDENNFSIASDRWSEYSDWIKEEIPFAKHQSHSGSELKEREKEITDDGFDILNFSNKIDSKKIWVKNQKNGKVIIKAFDPLFVVNQKCALLRARLSRLRKRFWGFTQKIENLEHHLWLFIALNNKYTLPA